MTINSKAPVVQRKEILINERPETVWAVLSNIDAWAQWNPKIKKPQTEGLVEKGTGFSWTINGSKITSAIHTFVPNKRMGWTGKTFGASAIHNWYLEATENGTKVRVEESMEGWLIALMKKKMNQLLADDMRYWLEQLKNECEK